MIIKILLTTFLLVSTLFASGGDDSGNGGHAFRQSEKLLVMATASLSYKIIDTALPALMKNPNWRDILRESLKDSRLVRLPRITNVYRGDKLLAMDYDRRNNKIKIYRPFYEAFAGRTDDQLETVSLEVQKRLVHEAAHLWGHNEEQAESFAIDFMSFHGSIYDQIPDRDPVTFNQESACFCKGTQNFTAKKPSCDQFCSDNGNSKNRDLIFYGEAILTNKDLQNSNFGNFYNWCKEKQKRTIEPRCLIKIETSKGGPYSIALPILIKNSNRFQVVYSNYTKTRALFQIYQETIPGLDSNEVALSVEDPKSTYQKIITSSLDRFFCQRKSYSNDPLKRKERLTYYVTKDFNLLDYPGSEQDLVCHDEIKYGEQDSIKYPRLGFESERLNLYDPQQNYFQDKNENEKLDIEDLIEKRLVEEFNLDINLKIFGTFYVNTRMIPLKTGGYFLFPFMNKVTNQSFCPTKDDFTGDDPLLHVLGEFISDTEALYMGVTNSPNSNHLFLSQTELKVIWYYVNSNGEFAIPSEADFQTRQIFFNWPADRADPFILKENQITYSLKNYGHLGDNKKIGCIPVK